MIPANTFMHAVSPIAGDTAEGQHEPPIPSGARDAPSGFEAAVSMVPAQRAGSRPRSPESHRWAGRGKRGALSRRSLLDALPWLLITLFSIAYVRLALLNHYQFRTGLDLGIYGQAMYHVSHFRLPYSTFKEQVLWGDHAHFILVFLAPLYRLFPDVRVLLVIQALAVTLSGWALYRVALDVLRSRLFALASLLSYLAFVGIQYAIDFDFHPSVLTGTALLWAIYASHFKKPLLYWISVALGLITREDAGPIFFMLGVYLFLSGCSKRSLLAALRPRFERGESSEVKTPAYAGGAGAYDKRDLFEHTLKRRMQRGLITTIMSAVYFFTVGYAIMPIWTPSGTPLAYLDVADKNPLKIFADIVLNPITTAQNMVDTPEKVRTMKTLFSAFGFLPLLAPFTYLASAPIFISRFLSPNEYRWLLQSHSNANILPVLAYGSVLGAAMILRLAKRSGLVFTQGIAWGLSVILLAGTYWTGWRDPDVPLRKLTRPEFTDREYLPVTGIAAFRLVKELIPPEGGVSASSGLVPHLSGRKYVVNFPEVKEHTHWIVLSPEFNTWPLRKGETDKAIAELLENPDWELLWQDYEIYLFKKKRFPTSPLRDVSIHNSE